MSRRLVLAVGAAVVLIAVAVAVPLLTRGDDDTTIEGIKTFEDLPSTHVAEEVDYDQTPPVGGPHAAEWLACGFYDRPVREENLVHSLEHGTVHLAYGPDVAADDVAALFAELPDRRIASPYDDLDAPLVLTVWGVQLELTGADDPRFEEFLQAYGDGGTSPEGAFASCAGGLVAYEDGSAPA